MSVWMIERGNIVKNFLTLVQAGLWSRSVELEGEVTESDWREIHRLATEQTVVGVAYRGLELVKNLQGMPQDLLAQWAAETDAIEQRNKMMNEALDDLLRMFHSYEFYPVILKGQPIAELYNDPYVRQCGDIDICFETLDEKEAAANLLTGMGVKLTRCPDGSDFYSWKGVPVEHHRSFIGPHNPFRTRDIMELAGVLGFSDVELENEYDTDATVPSPHLTFLILNNHILKHSVGRGIGLRQFCDLARAYHIYYFGVESGMVRRTIQLAGMERWTKVLHSFLRNYLALDDQYIPKIGWDDEGADELMDIVLAGGNFGQYYGSAGGRRDGSRRDGRGVGSAEGGEAGAEGQSVFKRKTATLAAFLRNGRFAMRVAPMDTLAVVWDLLKGQFSADRK